MKSDIPAAAWECLLGGVRLFQTAMEIPFTLHPLKRTKSAGEETLKNIT